MKALADELNIDSTNEALAQVQGLGFDLGSLGQPKVRERRAHLGEQRLSEGESEALKAKLDPLRSRIADAEKTLKGKKGNEAQQVRRHIQQLRQQVRKIKDANHKTVHGSLAGEKWTKSEGVERVTESLADKVVDAMNAYAFRMPNDLGEGEMESCADAIHGMAKAWTMLTKGEYAGASARLKQVILALGEATLHQKSGT